MDISLAGAPRARLIAVTVEAAPAGFIGASASTWRDLSLGSIGEHTPCPSVTFDAKTPLAGKSGVRSSSERSRIMGATLLPVKAQFFQGIQRDQFFQFDGTGFEEKARSASVGTSFAVPTPGSSVASRTFVG